MRDRAVCLCTDAGYFPLAYVLARRLAASAGRSYDVVIVTDVEIAVPDGVIAIRSPALDKLPPSAPYSERITRAAYYRMFLADILPEHYRRVVYLDCDITVDGDLEDLFALPMQARPIAAVADCGFVKRASPERRQEWDDYLRSVSIDPHGLYFNSGVFLADMDSWRALDIGQKAVRYLQEYGRTLTGMDQDSLNHVFAGAVLEISPRWNYQTLYFDSGIEEIIRPAIYHHLDTIKPWHDLVYTSNEHSRYFSTAFDDTPWPGFIRASRTRQHYARRLRWSARAWLRAIPSVQRRFEVEAKRKAQFRSLSRTGLGSMFASGRYADLDLTTSRDFGRRILALA